jgi:hypothetical protein
LEFLLKFSSARLSLALVALAAVSLSADQTPRNEYDQAAANRVYDALLGSRYFSKGPDRIVWVIRTETEGSIWTDCMPKAAELDFDDWQIIRDFVRENQTVKVLDSQFKWSAPVEIVSRQVLQDTLDSGPAWDQFYERYPESPGTLVFSAVGFNERRDHALVKTTFECGLLCGGIRFLALERQADVWRVVESPIPCVAYF